MGVAWAGGGKRATPTFIFHPAWRPSSPRSEPYSAPPEPYNPELCTHPTTARLPPSFLAPVPPSSCEFPYGPPETHNPRTSEPPDRYPHHRYPLPVDLGLVLRLTPPPPPSPRAPPHQQLASHRPSYTPETLAPPPPPVDLGLPVRLALVLGVLVGAAVTHPGDAAAAARHVAQQLLRVRQLVVDLTRGADGSGRVGGSTIARQ